MDAELVNKITEQVIEALGQQGDAVQSETPLPKTQEPTESKPTDPDVHRDPSALEARSVSRVFVTVDDLTQRLSGKNGSVIELAHNEFLTPAAVDLVEAKNLTISKASAPEPQPAEGTMPSQETSGHAYTLRSASGESMAPEIAIGLVIDRTDEKVRSVIDSLSRDGIGFSRFEKSSCWMENVRSMCQSVASGELPAGVVIMPYATDAMVLANKINGIRAVQGTRLESVKAGLRHFGANVLILEHAFSTFHEMCTMTRALVNGRGNQATSGLLLEAVGREERS